MKVRFKIKIGKGKDFYWCYIFSTREEMYDYNNNDGYFGGRSYLGVCRSFDRYIIPKKGRAKKVKNEQGIICFIIDSCRAGIVSHEMFHAVSYWFKDKYKDYEKLREKKYDELFAYEVGYLNAQFWDKWYKLKDKKRIK